MGILCFRGIASLAHLRLLLRGPKHTFLIIAFCIMFVAGRGAAQPAGGTCGIVGCSDHGDGIILSKDVNDQRIVVEFEVGVPDGAPYAHERLTLTPLLRREHGALIVELHRTNERLAAKIPSGLGAFWEMDLQDAEAINTPTLYRTLNTRPHAV